MAGTFAIVIGAFFIHSAAVTFSTWPWTTTESHAQGSVMGFEIGAAKRVCFDRAIELQRAGSIRALRLLDEARGTYDERFKGTNLSDADFAVVGGSDLWHVGLAGENAWLILGFVDGKLARVERKTYHGPTE